MHAASTLFDVDDVPAAAAVVVNTRKGGGIGRRLVEQEPRDWLDEAVCHTDDGRHVHLFYSDDMDEVAAAKRMCATCPAIDACLNHHIAERDGIFGGLDAKERERLRRARRYGAT